MRAVTYVFALLMFAAGFVIPASAKDVVCTGQDLVAKLQQDDPAKAKKLRQRADEQPFGQGVLWRVEADGADPSWIFGTMHIADPRLLDLPERAEDAFNKSGTVALEIAEVVDPAAMAAQSASLIKYTGYLDGTSLDDRMTAEQVALVRPLVAEKAGLPWNVASKMRPGTLMGVLALPACELARKRSGKPFLDLTLGLRAKAAGKQLVGLETLESQLKVLARLPEPLLIRSLVQTAQLGDKMDDLFETMVSQYEKQELGVIWAMMQMLSLDGANSTDQVKDYAEFQRIVVDERNVSMADKSEALIKKGSAFIAVGALHLPGEKGLINLLAERGYRISRP